MRRETSGGQKEKDIDCKIRQTEYTQHNTGIQVQEHTIIAQGASRSPSQPCKQPEIGVRLILVEGRHCAVYFYHVKLPLIRIPVEDSLDPRPSTPLEASPTRPRGSHPRFGHPCHVDICSVYAGVTASRPPSLRELELDRITTVVAGARAAAMRAIR